MASAEGVAPVMAFRGAAEFEAWLQAHVDAPAGVWLKLAKKGSEIASLSDDEAVDVGLCFGWISGQRKSLDARFYLQKCVPRRPRSRWSCVNVRKVQALARAGRMRPSGLAEVEAAKADGRWDAAYESQTRTGAVDGAGSAKPRSMCVRALSPRTSPRRGAPSTRGGRAASSPATPP
ncbi:OmdA domain containing protein [Myxococcus sp. K38C18041901]|uniref:YdeI/OmpD-associated family protein n=1 Tax=Myxococcus guangdongensis TaxID=2906760 RepID=UPI0020A7256B|nr:OmdA domain containing protein [Myxococcus guangdongensis]MCP3062905.1 OmdA domain containing protein [Myxococcus guangdongensis]